MDRKCVCCSYTVIEYPEMVCGRCRASGALAVAERVPQLKADMDRRAERLGEADRRKRDVPISAPVSVLPGPCTFCGGSGKRLLCFRNQLRWWRCSPCGGTGTWPRPFSRPLVGRFGRYPKMVHRGSRVAYRARLGARGQAGKERDYREPLWYLIHVTPEERRERAAERRHQQWLSDIEATNPSM